jgi:hypothetical protein
LAPIGEPPSAGRHWTPEGESGGRIGPSGSTRPGPSPTALCAATHWSSTEAVLLLALLTGTQTLVSQQQVGIRERSWTRHRGRVGSQQNQFHWDLQLLARVRPRDAWNGYDPVRYVAGVIVRFAASAGGWRAGRRRGGREVPAARTTAAHQARRRPEGAPPSCRPPRGGIRRRCRNHSHIDDQKPSRSRTDHAQSAG